MSWPWGYEIGVAGHAPVVCPAVVKTKERWPPRLVLPAVVAESPGPPSPYQLQHSGKPLAWAAQFSSLYRQGCRWTRTKDMIMSAIAPPLICHMVVRTGERCPPLPSPLQPVASGTAGPEAIGVGKLSLFLSNDSTQESGFCTSWATHLHWVVFLLFRLLTLLGEGRLPLSSQINLMETYYYLWMPDHSLAYF